MTIFHTFSVQLVIYRGHQMVVISSPSLTATQNSNKADRPTNRSIRTSGKRKIQTSLFIHCHRQAPRFASSIIKKTQIFSWVVNQMDSVVHGIRELVSNQLEALHVRCAIVKVSIRCFGSTAKLELNFSLAAQTAKWFGGTPASWTNA